MQYYFINEDNARIAHEMNSMRSYVAGSATLEYQKSVDRVYAIGDKRKEKYPEETERIDFLCDKYSKKLADWYNKHFKVEAMCPSVLVSGASNFPVHKKEKQNSRRDTLNKEWNDIQGIADKIAKCGTDAIKSDDDKAVEKIALKIEKLKDLQETMKAVNAYYRKEKTLDGCPFLSCEQIKKMKAAMNRDWFIDNQPFPSYHLSNNNAEIHRLEKRLKELEAIKTAGTKEETDEEIEGLTIKENAEAMRIQLLFDDKPSEEIRAILKECGFKWSPKFTAWQRMLNDNGKYATRQAIKRIKELNNKRSEK